MPELTPRQREAVEHFNGPLLVVAGAGSGKTTVLAERVAHLIGTHHVPPESIAAVTYTKKAAAMLTARIAKLVGEKASREVQSSTFHAYCAGTLERYGATLAPLEDMDLKIYLRQHWEQIPLRHFIRAADPAGFIDDLLKFICRCQDEMVSEEDFSAYVDRLERQPGLPLPRLGEEKIVAKLTREQGIACCREIAEVYRWLRAHLAERRWGTFGDMVINAIRLLEHDDAILRQEQARTRFLLIDEFQDSNYAQVHLLRILAGGERNVFAVGDPDQSIYQFRGANAASFAVFQKLFPGTRMVNLDTNYRSLAPILRVGFSVISHNPPVEVVTPEGASHVRSLLQCGREEAAKRSRQRAPQTLPQLVLVPNDRTEAELVADELERAHAEGEKWRQCAVLYRSHAHREVLLDVLRERAIPAEVRGVDLLATPELRDLCAVLDALQDFGDSAALFRVCSLPQFHIDPLDLRHALVTSRADSLATALPKVRGGEAVLTALRQTRSQTQVASVLADGGADLVVRNFALPESLPLQVMRGFVARWMAKPTTHERSFSEFMAWFQVYRDMGCGVVEREDNDEPDLLQLEAVQLMTVHKAKGLEFKRVFVLRVNQGAFPKNHSKPLFAFPAELTKVADSEPRPPETLHEEEERRLFYVAVTRAEDALWIYNKPRYGKHLSRFAKELCADASLKGLLTVRALCDSRVKIAAQAAAVGTIGQWLELPPRPEVLARPLSANAIQRYDECPLKFKIAYDLAIPGLPSPQLHFGTAVHEALRAYYDSVLAGRIISLEVMLGVFEERFSAGHFDNETQRELYRRQGREQLTVFFNARRGATHPSVMATEKEFRVEIGGVIVRGRMDRMDDLGGGAVAIEDYKTGRAREQKHADESLQLSIYALAARRMGLRPEKLSLYSLEDDQVVLTVRSTKTLQEAEEKIGKVAAGIAARQFGATPGYVCKRCEYFAICPAQERPLLQIASAAVN